MWVLGSCESTVGRAGEILVLWNQRDSMSCDAPVKGCDLADSFYR